MLRKLAVVTFSAILFAGCSGTGAAEVVDVAACEEPPDAALTVMDDSNLEVEVEPMVVTAGQLVTISIDLEPEFAESLDPDQELTLGDGTLWRCWNGETWTPTHILTKSSGGGSAIPWSLSTDNTVNAWGAPIPNEYRLTVPPEMPPGTYQIAEPDWLAPSTEFWEDFVVTIVEVED